MSEILTCQYVSRKCANLWQLPAKGHGPDMAAPGQIMAKQLMHVNQIPMKLVAKLGAQETEKWNNSVSIQHSNKSVKIIHPQIWCFLANVGLGVTLSTSQPFQ